MKRWITGISIAALVLAAGGAGYWLGHETSAAPTSQPADDAAVEPTATVQTQPATRGTIAQTIDVYGTVRPTPGSTMNLTVPIDVRVTRVAVLPGAHVAAGDVLIEVGPTPDTELQLRQAQDALAAADRNLKSAQSRLAEQLATNADVATAEQAQQSAKTQLDGLTTRVAESRRQLKSDQAGIVSQVTAQPGQLATAGTTLAVFTPDEAVEAVVGVEPSDASRVKAGDVVELVDALDEHAATIAGTIRVVTPQVNADSRLRDVAVTFSADAPFVQGQAVVAHLTIARASGLIVPRAAVTTDGDDPICFVVRDGKAIRTIVSVGLMNHDAVQMLGDTIREGDAVVVSGGLELEDGMAVATTQPATEEAK